MKKEAPSDIYIITTAKKRDSLDWEMEAAKFGISTQRSLTSAGVLTVDSWNNIDKYRDIEDGFFIFDEQRLVGNGSWVKSFYRIAKGNRWILLSATPGDTWIDYVPVFIANGLYRNASQFKREHVVYRAYSRYPQIERYIGERTLEKYRNMLLVEMPYERHTERIEHEVVCQYDEIAFNKVVKKRWHVYENRPLKDVSEMFRVMRKVVNSDPSRLEKLGEIVAEKRKVIVFYNFDYELALLREWCETNQIYYSEWNGHYHQEPPEDEPWVYLVQYVAGSEGWNCTYSDTICFFSLSYSYKNFMQAKGRIDRLDTPFKFLHYYIFVSNSMIDRAVKNSLKHKKMFNERAFVNRFMASDQEFWREAA